MGAIDDPIVFPRGWMDEPALNGRNEPYTRPIAWLWLIEQAAWREGLSRQYPRGISVPKGAVAASAKEMAQCWGWQQNRVRRFLGALESADMIKIGECISRGILLVHVVGYEQFAGEGPDDEIIYPPFLGTFARPYLGIGSRYLPTRVREAVFAAGGGACFYCGTPLSRESGPRQFHVDHKKALILGGTDSLANLVAACATCNLRKGSKPLAAFVAERCSQ